MEQKRLWLLHFMIRYNWNRNFVQSTKKAYPKGSSWGFSEGRSGVNQSETQRRHNAKPRSRGSNFTNDRSFLRPSTKRP